MKLIVFDVDGTLIDSQSHITGAMTMAFEKHGLSAPTSRDIRLIIGLSLPEAIKKLYPRGSNILSKRIIETYIDSFALIRKNSAYQIPQIFVGMRELLEDLSHKNDYILGIATGKGLRGLDHVLGITDLKHYFSTIQTADNHPSKPHPGMLYSAVRETGVSPRNAVMVGDTSYDMDMGNAAKFKTIGVSWGYHSCKIMKEKSDIFVQTPKEISRSLKSIWS